MKQQKRPFTVTVKRKKRTPASGSLLADALAKEQKLEKAELRSKQARRPAKGPPELAAIGRISTASPIKPNGTAEAAPHRVPRILNAPTPEREIVPVDKPRRGPGRPRKHLLMDETLPDRLAPNTVSKTDADRTKTEKYAEATALPVSPSPKGSAKNDGEHTKTSAPSPVESDRIIHERRSPGSTRRSRRRAAADASLKRGDRWKRHLPRWSR